MTEYDVEIRVQIGSPPDKATALALLILTLDRVGCIKWNSYKRGYPYTDEVIGPMEVLTARIKVGGTE